jgi:hypothetical protein
MTGTMMIAISPPKGDTRDMYETTTLAQGMIQFRFEVSASIHFGTVVLTRIRRMTR